MKIIKILQNLYIYILHLNFRQQIQIAIKIFFLTLVMLPRKNGYFVTAAGYNPRVAINKTVRKSLVEKRQRVDTLLRSVVNGISACSCSPPIRESF